MTRLVLTDVTVSYHARHGDPAVNSVSLSVEDGAFEVFLGPSGCGKSTLLNSVAGLVQPTGGQITLDGEVLYDAERGINVPPHRRGLGMVFQSYALWPNMTVFANVAYPLRRAKVPKPEVRHRVLQTLALVRCSEFADRYPGQLSGGQQQRIALARALAPEPTLLLFDEPLSNLDAELRRELRDELDRLHSQLGFTALYVTHDQLEAFGLATRTIIMNAGRVEQIGAPAEVYERPETAYVAGFLGANLFELASGDAKRAIAPLLRGVPTGAALVAVNPSRISLEPATSENSMTVQGCHFAGSHWDYVIDVGDGRTLRVFAPFDRPQFTVGTAVTPRVEARDVHSFDLDGGRIVPGVTGSAKSMPVALLGA